MSYKTKAQLKAQVDAVIKVNGNREITPPLDNGVRTNFIDSFLALEGGNVLLSLTGYNVDLTPVDDKQLTPKKYVDDLSLLLLPLDGSRETTNHLQFGDYLGIIWNSGSSIMENSGDIEITTDKIYLPSNGVELSTDQDFYINSYSANITVTAQVDLFLHSNTGHLNLDSADLTASTVVYLDASKNLISLANAAGVLTNDGSGGLSWAAGGGGSVSSVSGTTNRITSTGGTTPVIDISASYVGQSSITTLGTITTGVWSGTAVAVGKGGNGLTTVASGSVLGYNALDTASAITSTSGLKVLQNSAGTVSWNTTTGTGDTVMGTSPAITTSLTTGSTTFALINTTATTVNFAGAATTLNIGNASGTTNLSGLLSLSPDIDGIHSFGRGKIGTITGTDQFGIAHYDNASSSGYALVSLSGGALYLNGCTSSLIYFNIGGTLKMQMDSSSLLLQSGVSLTVASDSDVTTVLGRARIHSVTSDVMHISHFDQSTSTTYALKQSNAGVTTLNGVTGQTLRLAVANAIILQVGTTALTVASSVILNLAASSTSRATLNIPAGVAPSSPADGDVYYIDTNDRLMFYKNATACEIISASAVTTEALVSDTTLTITYNGTTYKLLARA